MEDEVLLDMYKNSWNDFLDAYNVKIDQNVRLLTLLKKVVDSGSLEKNQIEEVRDELKKITEL